MPMGRVRWRVLTLPRDALCSRTCLSAYGVISMTSMVRFLGFCGFVFFLFPSKEQFVLVKLEQK